MVWIGKKRATKIIIEYQTNYNFFANSSHSMKNQRLKFGLVAVIDLVKRIDGSD